MLTGFFGVMGGVDHVTVRQMGVMSGFVVVAGFVMFGGCFVMPGSMLMMFGGFAVVFSGFLRHSKVHLRSTIYATYDANITNR